MIDLDGAMVNALGDFCPGPRDRRAGRLLALPAIDPLAIEHMVGKGTEHLLRTVLAHVGVADVDARYADAWQRYQHHYLQLNGQYAQLYPGVLEGVQALAASGLPLACLTNKPLAFASPCCAPRV